MRINRESAESVCKNVIIQEVVLNCQRKLFLFAFGCFYCLADIYEIGSQFCIAANKLPLSRCNTFWIALSSFDSPDIIGLDITNWASSERKCWRLEGNQRDQLAGREFSEGSIKREN